MLSTTKMTKIKKTSDWGPNSQRTISKKCISQKRSDTEMLGQ